MPRKFIAKKKPVYRKRKYVRRVKRNGPARTLRVNGSPIANSTVVTLKYCDTFTVNPTAAGVIAAQLWKANSAYDPDYAVGGHQPMGFDQWMTFYNHYQVLSSHITAYFTVQSTDSVRNDAYGGIYLDDDTTTISGMNAIMEQSNSTWKPLNLSGSGGAVKIRKSFNSRTFFKGWKSPDSLRGNSGADPAEMAYFHVWTCGALTDSPPATIQLVIMYKLLLTEPRTLAQS